MECFDILKCYFIITFFSESDKIPTWFYIVRVQQKPPCAVVHIAFLLGTPSKLRHQVCQCQILFHNNQVVNCNVCALKYSYVIVRRCCLVMYWFVFKQ